MQKNNRRSSSNLTELELLDDLRQENELLKTELAKLCKQISDAPAIAEGSLRDDHCTQIQLLKGLLSQEKARYEALKSRTSVVESELDRSEHNTVLLQLHSNSLQDELQRTKSEMELSEKENLILSSTIDSMTSKIKLLEDMVHEKTEENGVMEIALEKANRDLVIVCKDNQALRSEVESMKHRSDSIYRDNEQLKLALEKAEIKIATVRSEVFTLERKCESQSKEIVRLHSSGYIFRTNVNAMDKRDHRINEKQTTFMEDTSCKFWK